MVHNIEASNPPTFDLPENFGQKSAVVETDTAATLAQMVRDLYLGDAIAEKSVLADRTDKAAVAPRFEASAATDEISSMVKAEAARYAAMQDAAAAVEMSKAGVPDVSQTGETVTLPPGYEYAESYSLITTSTVRKLRVIPTLESGQSGTLPEGITVKAIELKNYNSGGMRWFYVPSNGTYMAVENLQNPGVSIQSTTESVTPSAVATPNTVAEETAIPPQAGTNEPPDLEVTPTLEGPEMPDAPAFAPVTAEQEGIVDIESVEGYTLPDLARDVISVYPVSLENGACQTQIIVKANTDKFRDNNWPIYQPSQDMKQAADAAVQTIASTILEGVDCSEIVMHGVDKAPYRANQLNESAKGIFVPPEFTSTFNLREKPLVIVWVSDHRDVPGLYFHLVQSTDTSVPSFGYLIDPSEGAVHNVMYLFSANQKKNAEIGYGVSVLALPLSVIRYNYDNANVPNFSIVEDLKSGSMPWTRIPTQFPEVAERAIPALSSTLVPMS